MLRSTTAPASSVASVRTRHPHEAQVGDPCRALRSTTDPRREVDRDALAPALVSAVVVLRPAGAHLAGDSRPPRPHPQARAVAPLARGGPGFSPTAPGRLTRGQAPCGRRRRNPIIHSRRGLWRAWCRVAVSAQRGLRPRGARPRPGRHRFVSPPPAPRPGRARRPRLPRLRGPPDRRARGREPSPPGSRGEAALPAPLARPIRGPRRAAAGGPRGSAPLARLSRDRRRGGPAALLGEPLGRSRPAPPLATTPPAARTEGRQRGRTARADRGRPGPRLVPPLEAGAGRGAKGGPNRYAGAPSPSIRCRAVSRRRGSGWRTRARGSSCTATACASTRPTPSRASRGATACSRSAEGWGPRCTTGRSASCTTRRRATSGRSRSPSTRSCATRARTCCTT